MHTVITLNNTDDPRARYVGWSPVIGAIRIVDPAPVPGPVPVTIRNQNAAAGGQLVFSGGGPFQDQVNLSLPINGTPVTLVLAGKFGRPSVADRDAVIEVQTTGGAVLSQTPMMVRVRKNANTLTPAERSRVISAFATLNGAGVGGFTRLRDIHRELSSEEAHSFPGFLPWHRAYLLDLERELQRIDPSVALPYWRFDQPAPNVFSPDFLGTSNAGDIVQFSASNPLQFWRTDGQSGVIRRPLFNTATETARVTSEAATLRLGEPGNLFSGFDDMEASPHNRAHTSFGGFIGSIEMAARDPLFFLLHANADRLWAKWQWFFRRFNTASTATYQFLGAAGNPGSTRIGHNLFDTMWPWNRNTTPPRPPTAPGSGFPAAPFIAAPGVAPRVGDVINYQGMNSPVHRLGFDYDDVPFEP